jgi:hypothetical protein
VIADHSEIEARDLRLAGMYTFCMRQASDVWKTGLLRARKRPTRMGRDPIGRGHIMTLRSCFKAAGKAQACSRVRGLTAATGAAAAVMFGAAGCANAHHAASSSATTATPSPTPTTSAAATPTQTPLTSTASVIRNHPIIGRTVGIMVFTTANARIVVVAHFPAGDREKTAREDASGEHTFWFQTAGATPGYRVKVDVRVYAHGRKRSSHVWFTPRQKPPPPPPSSAPPPAPVASSSAPAPSGCYPKTSSGNCYEPGEFCPHADAGMHGVAGDGKAIICENNNGLRWEPA